MAEGAVVVNIVGKADKLVSAFKDSEKAVGNFGDKFEGVGTKIKDFGKKVVEVGAIVGTAAIAFGTKAVMAASDVEESLSKVNTVFGKNGAEIDKWAKAAAQNIGLSRGEALAAAGDFGQMLSQMGFTTKEATKMSTGMINLAADFASFNNADISDVIAAQSAAFRGEYDSIQKYLPMMSAATVEAQMAKNAAKGLTFATEAQAKAFAVNQMMAEGAGKATGDFARTSDGLANQMRILKAEGANFVAEVGSHLLPIVLKGLEIFKDLGGRVKDVGSSIRDGLMPFFDQIKTGVSQFKASMDGASHSSKGLLGVFQDLGHWAGIIRDFVVKDLIPGWSQMKAAMDGASHSSGGFIGVMQDVGFWISKISDFVSNNLLVVLTPLAVIVGTVLVAAVWGLVTAFAALFSPVVAVVAIVATLAAGAVYLYQRFEGVREAVDLVLDVFKSAFGALKGFFEVFVNTVVSLWNRFGNDILTFIVTMFGNLVEFFKGVFNTIKGIFDVFAGIFTGDWSKVWDGLKGIFFGVWGMLITVIKTAFFDIPNFIVQVFTGALSAAFSTAWHMLNTVFHAAWDGIYSGIQGALSSMVSWIGGLGGAIGRVASGMFDGIKDAFRAVINWVIDRWNSLSFTLPKVGPIGGETIGVPKIARIHTGGIIPGALGTDVPMIMQAGERVLARGAANRSVSGDVYLQVDGRTFAQISRQALLELQASDGNLGIEAA